MSRQRRCVCQDEIADLRRHTGSMSSYSYIPETYRSPAHRIEDLEQQISAIKKHLGIEFVKVEEHLSVKDTGGGGYPSNVKAFYNKDTGGIGYFATNKSKEVE